MDQRKFKRVYHPYWDWEEIKFNMWGDVVDRKEWVEKAIEFTGNHKLYGSYMMRVVNEWPISCENALTDNSINKRAWVGHAAVALAIQCPEDIVREAWGKLTDEQQLLADKEANAAIRAWANSYIENRGVGQDVGGSMLF